MVEPVNEFRGTRLTGLADVKDTLAGKDAVIACSGPSFRNYEDALIPSHVLRVAINETIRFFAELGRPPDYWVFSDQPIVEEYHQYHHGHTKLLVMHEATQTFRRYLPDADAHTVNSMAEVRDFDNPYQFYSRGTVLIGAIEMLRYMGIDRVFVFGCDFYRTEEAYYFDGDKQPRFTTETRLLDEERIYASDIPENIRLYSTPNLQKMTRKMRQVEAAGLWKDIDSYCVASPWSQQSALEKVSLDEAVRIMSGSEKSSRPRVSPGEHPDAATAARKNALPRGMAFLLRCGRKILQLLRR